MDNYKFTVIERARFAKTNSDCLAYVKFDDKNVRIYVKKNQTRAQKIQYIIHEIWEWGTRAVLNGAIPAKQTNKTIDIFCNTMDATTIKLIKPYL